VIEVEETPAEPVAEAEEVVGPVLAPEPEVIEVEETPAEPVAEAGAEVVSITEIAEEVPKKTTRKRTKKITPAEVKVTESEETLSEVATDVSVKEEESAEVKEDDVTAEAS